MPRAVRVTETLLAEFGGAVASWTLVPGRGGMFEVLVDGELLYSKLATGRHATVEELRDLMAAHAAQEGRASG